MNPTALQINKFKLIFEGGNTELAINFVTPPCCYPWLHRYAAEQILLASDSKFELCSAFSGGDGEVVEPCLSSNKAFCLERDLMYECLAWTYRQLPTVQLCG